MNRQCVVHGSKVKAVGAILFPFVAVAVLMIKLSQSDHPRSIKVVFDSFNPGSVAFVGGLATWIIIIWPACVSILRNYEEILEFDDKYMYVFGSKIAEWRDIQMVCHLPSTGFSRIEILLKTDESVRVPIVAIKETPSQVTRSIRKIISNS
jgi:hypothetical protein